MAPGAASGRSLRGACAAEMTANERKGRKAQAAESPQPLTD